MTKKYLGWVSTGIWARSHITLTCQGFKRTIVGNKEAHLKWVRESLNLTWIWNNLRKSSQWLSTQKVNSPYLSSVHLVSLGHQLTLQVELQTKTFWNLWLHSQILIITSTNRAQHWLMLMIRKDGIILKAISQASWSVLLSLKLLKRSVPLKEIGLIRSARSFKLTK